MVRDMLAVAMLRGLQHYLDSKDGPNDAECRASLALAIMDAKTILRELENLYRDSR